MTFDQAGKRKIEGYSASIHIIYPGNPTAKLYEGGYGGAPNLMNEREEL